MSQWNHPSSPSSFHACVSLVTRQEDFHCHHPFLYHSLLSSTDDSRDRSSLSSFLSFSLSLCSTVFGPFLHHPILPLFFRYSSSARLKTAAPDLHNITFSFLPLDKETIVVCTNWSFSFSFYCLPSCHRLPTYTAWESHTRTLQLSFPRMYSKGKGSAVPSDAQAKEK